MTLTIGKEMVFTKYLVCSLFILYPNCHWLEAERHSGDGLRTWVVETDCLTSGPGWTSVFCTQLSSSADGDG